MISPQSATRYHRRHPREEWTHENSIPRFSSQRNYNSSNHSNAYDTCWRPYDSYAHIKCRPFQYNTDSSRNRDWNEEANRQPDRYFDYAPIFNSTFEKQHSPPRRTKFEYFSRNSTFQDSNLLTERNKWSERSRSPLHEADPSPSSYHQIHQQASNSRIEIKLRQWQNNLRESQFSDHDKSYIYDSYYGYARKEDSTEIVLEKDSIKISKFPKRKDILTCLICSEEVKRRDIKGHLLFGSVQCLSCPWNAKNCKDFSERHIKKIQCSHLKLQWELATVDQISKNPMSKDKKTLKDYLASTIALKYYAPYDIAYNYFQTIVNEMPDEDCVVKSAAIDNDFEQNKFHDPLSDAGIDSEVNINKNVTATCNNSEKSTSTLLQNLEEFVKFDQSLQPHVLQNESGSGKINFELKASKKIVSDTVSRTDARKEYLESSSNSRRHRKKNKASKIVSVKDKHQTLIIGASNDDSKETENSAVTLKNNEEKEYHSKDRDILPSFVSDNYVLTYALSDDCPQCYALLNPLEFTVCMKSHIVVAKCEECSLYICFRNKLIESFKSCHKK